jgi:signal transduction histidine kinase
MRLGSLLERWAADALVVLIAGLGQVELWYGSPPSPSFAAVVAALAPLPLLLRRRFPFAAPALVFAALAGISLAASEAAAAEEFLILGSWFSLALAFWFAGAQDEGEQAVAGAAVGLASVAVLAGSAGRDFVVFDENRDFGILTLFVIGGALSLAAFALRRPAQRAAELERRATRLEREREERTRAAVEAERGRIAVDLHDVIAHSVSVMTVQAGAARLLLAESPERARRPLEAVEETGRQALAEMRRLLGILRTDAGESGLAPQPGMASLSVLLDRVRQAGLPVELAVEGGPEYLPPGIDLAAYRIVQEALTNALEHANRAQALVTVRYRRGTLELEIADDGPVGRGDRELRGGLVAMRERVSVYGGELEAGPRTGGGYAVSAHLPLAEVQP